MVRPPKINNLMETIRKCLDEGRYLDTCHASQRQGQRGITRPEYLYVLRKGHHEPRKDEFVERYRNWNYSIRGKTIDERKLRVIVSFEKNQMLIITVIALDG